MLCSVSGSVTLVRFVQPLNAKSPTWVTPSSISRRLIDCCIPCHGATFASGIAPSPVMNSLSPPSVHDTAPQSPLTSVYVAVSVTSRAGIVNVAVAVVAPPLVNVSPSAPLHALNRLPAAPPTVMVTFSP